MWLSHLFFFNTERSETGMFYLNTPPNFVTSKKPYTSGTNGVFAKPPPLYRSPPRLACGVPWRTQSRVPSHTIGTVSNVDQPRPRNRYILTTDQLWCRLDYRLRRFGGQKKTNCSDVGDLYLAKCEIWNMHCLHSIRLKVPIKYEIIRYRG